MAQEYETLLHRWFEEVWNQQNEAAIDEMLADDAKINGFADETGKTLCGCEAFKGLQRTFLSAYPDLHITIEDYLTDGETIAVRCKVRATHTGDGLGITPTNQPIDFTGMGFAKVKDGKIVEAWNEFDFMKMYTQVGALTLNLK